MPPTKLMRPLSHDVYSFPDSFWIAAAAKLLIRLRGGRTFGDVATADRDGVLCFAHVLLFLVNGFEWAAVFATRVASATYRPYIGDAAGIRSARSRAAGRQRLRGRPASDS